MRKFEKYIQNYELHCKRIAKASTVKINETPAEKLQRIRKLESDYAKWFEYYFANFAKSKCAWFHKELANKVISNSVIFQLVDWFRGSAKSVHVTMGIPLYLMFVKKELNYMLLIGATEPRAQRLLSAIQAQLKFNNRLINDYGSQFQHGDWSHGDFVTKNGVRFTAIGIDQEGRGLREDENRPDYIVGDDLDKLKRCNNDRLIREYVDFITSDIWGCFDTQGPRRFLFANNLIHKNSIMANLIKEFKIRNKEAEQKGLKHKHFHMRVPIKNKHGKSNWPEKNTDEECDEIIASMPWRAAMREFFCMPIQDGTIFKVDQIQYKNRLRLSEYDALCIYGDLSYKDTGDYKALVFLGKKGRELHVINCYVRQGSRRMAAIWLYDLYEDLKLFKYNIKYKIEGLFAQDEFVNDFDLEGDDRGYHIPVVADKKPKTNKFARIEAKAGYFERKNVWFNTVYQDTPDFTNLVDQLLAFEKGSGAADDAPDALVSAIDEVERVSYTESFEPRQGKRKKEEAF